MDYEALDRLITALESSIHDSNPQRGYWRDLWASVREIGAGYPTREEREQAWEQFSRARREGESPRAVIYYHRQVLEQVANFAKKI